MASAAPVGAPSIKTVVSHVALPVIMGLVMAVAYLGGFHKPAPHDLPIAVVGTTAQTQQIAQGMREAYGDKADVTVVATQGQAVSQLKHLKISGAYVPGAESATLLVNPMASDAAKSVVTAMVSPVAVKQHLPLQSKDVVAAPESDPAGQNAFFFLVALTVGSYASAIATGAAGAGRRFRDRIAIGAGAAVVISTLSFLIARIGYGMFPGHELTVWALSVLYSASVLAVGVGLHPILGRFSTVTYAAVFVAINFTTSGGVFPPSLQPAFFGWLHHFWIGSGFVEGLRRILYFPDVSIAGPMAILVGWFVLGLICLALGHTVESRRKAAGQVAAAQTKQESDLEEELEEDVAV